MRERKRTKKWRKQFLSASIGYDMPNLVETETKEELKRQPSYMTFYSFKNDVDHLYEFNFCYFPFLFLFYLEKRIFFLFFYSWTRILFYVFFFLVELAIRNLFVSLFLVNFFSFNSFKKISLVALVGFIISFSKKSKRKILRINTLYKKVDNY